MQALRVSDWLMCYPNLNVLSYYLFTMIMIDNFRLHTIPIFRFQSQIIEVILVRNSVKSEHNIYLTPHLTTNLNLSSLSCFHELFSPHHDLRIHRETTFKPLHITLRLADVPRVQRTWHEIALQSK
jgi:hypothetical protein